MIRRERLWQVAIVALVVVLAGPVRQAQAAERERTGLAQVWSWLAEVLLWGPTAVHADQCSMIDPDGRCHDAAGANSDQSLSIDPEGSRPNATPDQCSMIDPNGRCHNAAGTNSDQGSYIDPNG
jgi:hypothetical protein